MRTITKEGCIIGDHSFPVKIVLSNGDEYQKQRKCRIPNCINHRHIAYKLIKDQGMDLADKQRDKPKYPPERRAYVEGIKAHPEELLEFYYETRSLIRTAKEFNLSKTFVQNLLKEYR